MPSTFLERYGEWAIVTGASRGIGLEIARQLAEKGLNLVLVARSEDQLRKVEQEIKTKYSVKTVMVAIDVTQDNALEMIREKVAGLDIGLLVPNAGIEHSGHFLKISGEEHKKLLEVNIEAPMELVHHFSKALVEKRRGGVIFVSSLFGYQGVPYVANYSASKAYVISLGEALREELKEFGVDVLVVSPGLTDTDMPDNMPINWGMIPVPRMKPSRVAKIALASLGRKATVVTGMINKFYAWQNRLIPRTFPVKLFGFLVRRAYKKDAYSEKFITQN